MKRTVSSAEHSEDQPTGLLVIAVNKGQHASVRRQGVEIAANERERMLPEDGTVLLIQSRDHRAVFCKD